MKNIFLFISCLLISSFSFGQTKKFDKLLSKHLKNTVPILKIEEVNNSKNYLFLDAREPKEFNISHLENAKLIGFDYFDLEETQKLIPTNETEIIIYCSIGVRSEIIGEKLKKAGYKNVYNLYGGIFEWKNQSKKIVDLKNQPTNKVHTFSKEWSKWLLNGEKIYEQ